MTNPKVVIEIADGLPTGCRIIDGEDAANDMAVNLGKEFSTEGEDIIREFLEEYGYYARGTHVVAVVTPQ